MGLANPTYDFKGLVQKTHVRATLPHDISAAILTGQIAGLIMAAVVMLVFVVFLGKGLLYPVQVIGSFVFGDSALVGTNWAAIVAGLLLHQLGPVLFWSLVFGLFIYYNQVKKRTGFLLIGLGVGILSQIIDVNLILPTLFTAIQGHDIWAEQVPAFWSWAAHVVYGLSLGLYPIFDDYLAKP